MHVLCFLTLDLEDNGFQAWPLTSTTYFPHQHLSSTSMKGISEYIILASIHLASLDFTVWFHKTDCRMYSFLLFLGTSFASVRAKLPSSQMLCITSFFIS